MPVGAVGGSADRTVGGFGRCTFTKIIKKSFKVKSGNENLTIIFGPGKALHKGNARSGTCFQFFRK